ncbi:hypothetical protein ACYULU_05285 [Breznakiellaceae bacterium SP9]
MTAKRKPPCAGIYTPRVSAVYDVFAVAIKETIGFQQAQKCAGEKPHKGRKSDCGFRSPTYILIEMTYFLNPIKRAQQDYSVNRPRASIAPEPTTKRLDTSRAYPDGLARVSSLCVFSLLVSACESTAFAARIWSTMAANGFCESIEVNGKLLHTALLVGILYLLSRDTAIFLVEIPYLLVEILYLLSWDPLPS